MSKENQQRDSGSHPHAGRTTVGGLHDTTGAAKPWFERNFQNTEPQCVSGTEAVANKPDQQYSKS